jgi:hypothetical protein
MSSIPFVVVANLRSRTAVNSGLDADCCVLGLFDSYAEAQRFVKLQNRENGDSSFCTIAEEAEVVELKPTKRAFAEWAAKQFRAMGDTAPSGWEERFKGCEEDEESGSDDSAGEMEEESAGEEEEEHSDS